jgi:haloacetate dehalogenase
MIETIEGFIRTRVDCGAVTLSVQQAGQGGTLLLLHGFPQNGLCWARVAPEFARHFRVLVPDLRGYGASDAPPDDPGHRTYSKRVMARDICGLLDALGLGSAMVLGHDRGARVAYRMALDHPARVTRLGIIEVAPTAEYWRAWGPDLAMAAWHWTFLAQPAPLPERLIGAAPSAYVDMTLAAWSGTHDLTVFAPAALASYRAQMADAARCHAFCADYRAGATVDRADDEADRASGRKIAAPLHFLWGRHGFPARTGDPAGIWRRWADSVTDHCVATGHFVMEEAPESVLDAFLPHFAAAPPARA